VSHADVIAVCFDANHAHYRWRPQAVIAMADARWRSARSWAAMWCARLLTSSSTCA